MYRSHKREHEGMLERMLEKENRKILMKNPMRCEVCENCRYNAIYHFNFCKIDKREVRPYDTCETNFRRRLS